MPLSMLLGFGAVTKRQHRRRRSMRTVLGSGTPNPRRHVRALTLFKFGSTSELPDVTLAPLRATCYGRHRVGR